MEGNYKIESEKDEYVDFLRDLAERLMAVPVMYGADQSDCDKLIEIANKL